MTTRSTKRTANEVSQLSHIEALLVAQGVWEMGINSSTWSAIAKILAKHPLVTRPKSFFSAQSCHAMYNHLLQQAGMEVTEENSAPKAAANLALAERHYKLRFDELRELIIAEENAFKTILKEIADIKEGNWDAQIKANLTGQSVKGDGSPSGEVQPTAPVESRGDESSDLSGVTETPSSIDESETPTAKTTTLDTSEPSAWAVNDAAAPASSLSTEDKTVEVEDKVSDEMPVELSVAEQLSDSAMHDIVAPANDNSTEQLLREEEEEEEDATTNKPEEEETDQEDDKAESNVEQDTQPPARSPIEHRPEEEEEEEERKDILEKDEEIEVEETLPFENGKPSSRASSEEEEEQSQREVLKQDGQQEQLEAEEPDQEDRDMTQKLEQPVEEGPMSDEEPMPTTRRSTRNKSSMPPVPATRKTRRQRRILESEAQSPIVTEGDNLDVDEIKVYTPEEYQASSPVPAEPTGLRRRKRKASVAAEPVESPRDRKRQRDESEPVEDDEPGPSYGRNRRRGDRSEEQVALKKFQNVIGMLHSQISQHRNGNIFHNPIRTVEAPDYHDIVKRPMDLKTIKGRVKDGLIANSLEYQRDIFLMFANAMMFNRPGSDVYHMAEDMMHESEGYINAFRQTEGLVRGRP